MKKSVVLALTAALACGAASTAFAANPFSDVPAGHWAYDYINQLVEAEVVNGYGDGTFRGMQELTRYEIAKMVAVAMAKNNNNAAAQEMIDKLAAEFSQELKSMGVRVGAVEKKVDNVKWFGELRYTARRENKGEKGKDGEAWKQNHMQLRLKAEAKVNKHWVAKSAFYYTHGNFEQAGTFNVSNDTGFVDHLYAKGQYGKTTIKLGKYENTEEVTEGMLWDAAFHGIEVSTGKDLKLTVAAARGKTGSYFEEQIAAMKDLVVAPDGDQYFDVVGGSLQYKKGGFGLGAAYYHFDMDEAGKVYFGKSKVGIWAVSAQTKLGDNLRLYGTYAGNSDAKGAAKSKDKDKAFNIELDYKGAKTNQAGSFGAHVAYKHLGPAVVTHNSTYDYIFSDRKGVEIAGEFMLEKNIRLDLGYFKGKTVSSKEDRELLHTRIHWFF